MSLVILNSVQAKLTMGRSSRLPGPSRKVTSARNRLAAPRWLLAREAMLNLLLVFGMVAVVWVGIWLHLGEERREIGERAATDSSNLAQAAAESIDQTISGIDDAMRFIRAIYVSDPRHFDIGVWTRLANKMKNVAPQFMIISRDGLLADSSLGPVDAATDLSGQRFFQQHVGDAPDRLFVSQPLHANPSGRWSLAFTRRISAADGWFMGVVAASVDPAWLTRLHQALDVGHGTVMLVGTDGFVRALALDSRSGGPSPGTSGSGREAGINRDLNHSALLDAALRSDQGTLDWVNPVDGRAQIISFKRLPDYSSFVAVGLDAQTVFAPYNHYARQYRVFGAGLTLLIMMTGYLLLSNTRRLLFSRQVLKDTMDAMSQGIVMTDFRGRVQVINRRADELLQSPMQPAGPGYRASVPGAPPSAVEEVAAPGVMPGGRIEERHGEPQEHRCANGVVLEIRSHALGTGGVVRTYTDITEQKNAEARITYLALHDSLTGLANRRLFAERLTEAISRASAGGRGCAVLWLDLDRFGDVNDLRGHAFGDHVLVEVSERLRSLVGPEDVVARLGGDEFCILQAGGEDETDLEDFAGRLLGRLSEPYDIDGQRVLLSASVGIALCPDDGISLDRLLANADAALYRAKKEGQRTFRLYEPGMGQPDHRPAAFGTGFTKRCGSPAAFGCLPADFQRCHQRRGLLRGAGALGSSDPGQCFRPMFSFP